MSLKIITDGFSDHRNVSNKKRMYLKPIPTVLNLASVLIVDDGPPFEQKQLCV